MQPLLPHSPPTHVRKVDTMTDRRFSAPDLARRLLAPIAALLGLVAGLSVLILPSPRWGSRAPPTSTRRPPTSTSRPINTSFSSS